MELRPEDLRIGNYFKWSEYASMGRGIDICTKENIFNHLNLKESVKITEDILLRLDAKLYPWGYMINDILIRWSNGGGNTKYWIELGNGKRIELPYLHTLQNFYSLTGEELKLKEQ